MRFLGDVLIHDQVDRVAIAWDLLGYREEQGDDRADVIDLLRLHPDARRHIVRLLGEIEAGDYEPAKMRS